MSSISKDILAPIEAVSGDGNNRVRVEFRRFLLPSKWLLGFLAIPMLIALGISAYLTYVTVTASEIAGCTGGQLFDCSHVIYSKWSKVFGIPVSALALVTYIAMVCAAIVTSIKVLSSPTRLLAWSAMTGLAIAAAFAALYFIFLQAFVLEHFCPWCLGAHVCGLLIAATVLITRNRIAMPPLASVSGLAAAGLALMIGIQVNSEEPPKYEMIELQPEISSNEDQVTGAEETFTAAPEDFESAPDEDDLMMPPEDDEDLFEPPVEEDDEDFMLPPSEDEDEDETALHRFQRSSATGMALLSQLAGMNTATSAVLYLQEPAKQEASSKAAASQTQKTQETTKQKSPPKQKPKAKPKKKSRIVQFMGRKLNAYQWPIDGNPSAKYVFVEMFDYTCPHCRTTSQAIFKVKEQMGDDLAVVVLPVPMKMECNPVVTRDHPIHQDACRLSELGVAVWRCDAKKFSEFHKWMFQGKDAPAYAAALAKAGELVGKERIEKELSKKTPGAYVKRHCQMYKMLNGGPVPKLLFPRRAIQGEYTSVDSLASMIRDFAGN